MEWISDGTLVNSSVFSVVNYYMKYAGYWFKSYSGTSGFKSGTGTENRMIGDGMSWNSVLQIYCEKSGRQINLPNFSPNFVAV